jgi:hypothetical protein
LPRLQKHYRKKEFWTDLVSFSAADKGLTKAHIQYIESQLVRLATEAKRCKMDNANTPALPSLPEADIAYVQRFVENILDCLAVLNLTFFAIPSSKRGNGAETFQLSGKGAVAQGYPSETGFVVLEGSTATKQLSNAFLARPWAPNLRQQLIDKKVVEDSGEAMRFTQDYEFDSPSAAAVIVYGNPMNGRTEWKTTDGRTLKEIQEQAVT